MKSILSSVVLAGIVYGPLAANPAPHPFLDWIAEPYIVIPEKTSPIVVDAAETIARAGGWGIGSVIVTDTWIHGHPAEAAYRDLIVIGTETGNSVFTAYPSTWARSTSPARESIKPGGLFVFGIGDIHDPHTGFIEPGRNPFTVLMADRAHHEGTAPPPPRWMLRLCGRTARGARRAVDVFLKETMLSGVIFSGGDPQGRKPFVVSSHELSKFSTNWNFHSIDPNLSFIGWHQADAILLSGLEARLGSRPNGTWRFVYRSDDETRRSAHSPHRSNSDFEILVLCMDTPDDAASGARRMLEEFGRVASKPRKDGTIFLVAGHDGDHTALVHGSCILLESFGDDRGIERLIEFVRGSE